MVVKKQLRKISKKIMILGLATSIIFTSCFSTKKIEAHATSIAASLGAYTLYEICLYIGGIAASVLGIGYAYENRDDIAEFGKSIIDNMSDLPALGWIMGSSTIDGEYVYGTEALQEVKDTQWTVIQGGGQSPKNDNDDDGDKDSDDREIELNLNKYFLTSFGINFLKNNLKSMYESWVQKDLNFFDSRFGSVDASYFDGFVTDDSGNYIGSYSYTLNGKTTSYEFRCTKPVACFIYPEGSASRFKITSYSGSSWLKGTSASVSVKSSDDFSFSLTNVPIHSSDDLTAVNNFTQNKKHPEWDNNRKTYRIADWLADDEAWTGILEDIATSLRSLQGLSNIAQELSENILLNRPTVNIAGDTLNEYANNTYAPVTNVFITQPTYYPVTNVTPKLDISVFPNYDIYIQNGGGSDTPDDSGGTDDVPEIDLDGLLSIFNILFYLIMIIVMLIYLFLSCLAFIVMIFRIPASSTMLPEEMVMGFDHLKTIMIPGMNISIYGFAMALIYMFIIFAVIKLIRLEINDFKFPRSYK